MKKILCVVCAVLTWGVARASMQSQAAAPASFEVASVKPSDPNGPGMLSMRPQGRSGLAVSNIPLRLLVRMAYNVQDFQIVGGPSWQMSSKFDITAKAAEGTTQGTQELLPMLKTLLADRFKLKTHTETREMPVYAMVLARSDGQLGRDLKPSTSDCSNAAADAQKRAEEIMKGGGLAEFMAKLAKGERIPCTIMPAMPSSPSATTGFGLRGDGQSMTALTQLLAQVTGRAVLDKTGLTGLYDWELRFDPTVLMALLPQLGINVPTPPANATAAFADSPSLLTALQEQLGLKLDSQRGPVEVLVIDSAEMPQPD